MPEAVHTLNTPLSPSAKPAPRGVMLATARTIALAGAPDADGTAPSPDAGLIALCERIVAGYDEIERSGVRHHGGPAHVRMRSAVLAIEGRRLSEAVAEMDATTPEGLRAKARATMAHARHTADGDPDWDNHGELLGWSLARDLLRGA